VEARDQTEVSTNEPGQEAGAASVVERGAETLAVEVVGMFVPECAGFLGKMSPETRVVEGRELLHLALSEELPELLIGKLLDGGDLEGEQCVLARILIDGIDVLAVEGVGKNVATSGGDDHHAILFFIQLEGF